MAPRELQQASKAGKILKLAVTLLFVSFSFADDVLNPAAAVVDSAAVDASPLVVPETVAVGVPPTGAGAAAAAATIPSAAATTGEVRLTGSAGSACMDRHTPAMDFNSSSSSSRAAVVPLQHCCDPNMLRKPSIQCTISSNSIFCALVIALGVFSQSN
jgi:hypothetical protein